MLAVLERAVNDFRTYAAVPTARGRRLFTDIEAWFGASTTDAFDFETICQAIGFEADYIRKGLQAPYNRSRQLPMRAASEPKIAAPSVRHLRSCERCRRRRAGARALDASTRGMRQVSQIERSRRAARTP
jgi:hypothetical protein